MAFDLNIKNLGKHSEPPNADFRISKFAEILDVQVKSHDVSPA